MRVFNDLKTRGVADILIAVTDGLKGMPEALAAAIRPIYTAPSAEVAQAELDAFEQSAWGQRFPVVTSAWRNAWDRVIPFFAFPPEVRKVIYTANAIKSINARLRKIIKTWGTSPMTMPPPNSSSWPCATSPLTGGGLPGTGNRPWCNLLSSMRIASADLPCNAQPALNTEFLTPPNYAVRNQPLAFDDSCMEDEDYLPLLERALGHASATIRQLAQSILDEAMRHPHRLEKLPATMQERISFLMSA